MEMFRKIFFNIHLSVEFMLYEKLIITFPFMDFFFIVFKLLKLFNIFPTFLSVYRQKDEYKPKKWAPLHKNYCEIMSAPVSGKKMCTFVSQKYATWSYAGRGRVCIPPPKCYKKKKIIIILSDYFAIRGLSIATTTPPFF